MEYKLELAAIIASSLFREIPKSPTEKTVELGARQVSMLLMRR
jgi:hypothetical protein